MELIRRVVLIGGVWGALWCMLWPTPELVSLSAADFAGRQKRMGKWRDESRLPLDQFIAHQTKDRLVQVEGPAWEAMLKTLKSMKTKGPVDKALRHRVGIDYSSDNLYFRPDEEPVASVANKLNDRRPFTYVALGTGDARQYLTMSWQSGGSASGSAPSAMLHPRRGMSLWLLLGAIAVYVLLPWPKRTGNMVLYSRASGGVMPDIVGVMLSSVFFVMPLLIIPSIASTPDLFDVEGGWIILTLIFWSLAGFGLAIEAIAAWYTSFRVVAGPDGLRRTTLFGSQDYAYTDIEAVSLAAYQPPRWLVKAGLLMSLLSWRALGPTLLVAGRSDPVLEVKCRDGRSFRLFAGHVHGLPGLVKALADADVAVEPDAMQLAAE